jgi:hypothetical protein
MRRALKAATVIADRCCAACQVPEGHNRSDPLPYSDECRHPGFSRRPLGAVVP